jgi:hypothetical protein
MTENQKHIAQCAKLLSVYSGASNEILDIVGSVEYVAFLQKLRLSIEENTFSALHNVNWSNSLY